MLLFPTKTSLWLLLRFHSLGLGDENVAGSKHGSMEADFDHWAAAFIQRLQKWNSKSKEDCGGEGDCSSDTGAGGQKTSDFDTSDDEEEEVSDVSEEEEDDLVDLEDLGKVMKKGKKGGGPSEPKEMITPLLRKSLTKQGYKLIGSHSGVKICRWTKAMLPLLAGVLSWLKRWCSS